MDQTGPHPTLIRKQQNRGPDDRKCHENNHMLSLILYLVHHPLIIA